MNAELNKVKIIFQKFESIYTYWIQIMHLSTQQVLIIEILLSEILFHKLPQFPNNTTSKDDSSYSSFFTMISFEK